jgi:hypothetical protein
MDYYTIEDLKHMVNGFYWIRPNNLSTKPRIVKVKQGSSAEYTELTLQDSIEHKKSNAAWIEAYPEMLFYGPIQEPNFNNQKERPFSNYYDT